MDLIYFEMPEEECIKAFLKLQDGLSPQAGFLTAKVMPQCIYVQLRRLFVASLAPTYICVVKKHGIGSEVAAYYRRGVTLTFWSCLAVFFVGLFGVGYLLFIGGMEGLLILVIFVSLIIFIFVAALQENTRQAAIKRKMLSEIVDAMNFFQVEYKGIGMRP